MDSPNGILVIDKVAGPTSARVVGAVKRLLPRGTKVGHAGSLDPFATGILLVLVGRATKSCEALMGQRKMYEATVKFGATTATDDPESPEIAYENLAAPSSRAHVEAALAPFIGTIQQRPPIYSALKIKGKRACDRVRDGQHVELQPRAVHIYAIELREYAYPLATLRIDCGRGTYIRAIARDLGEALHVGGHLTALRRTRIGEFDLSRSVKIDRLTVENLAEHLILIT